jgi:hypothetical protein
MNRLATISPAELEPALLLLPIGLVATLLRYVLVVLEETSFDASIDVELCARCAVYALRVHHKAVAAHADLREPLCRLRCEIEARIIIMLLCDSPLTGPHCASGCNATVSCTGRT